MNSFILHAVGNLARNPEGGKSAEGVSYTRFCLIGNDYAGKDEEGKPRELITSIWFVAFGPMGEAIAAHALKGDQLIVQARVRSNNRQDADGSTEYDHAFIVEGFRFGARGRGRTAPTPE
jgi:single-stranded DNA-binding protein